MTENLQSLLRIHLEKGESLLWTGKPPTGLVLRPSDVFLIPFSLVWCGFAIFWVFTAAQGGGYFALFGVPFVLIGLVMVVGRFIIDAKQREHTCYGLTESRVLIVSGIFSKNIKSLNVRTLSDIELNEKSDGSGTITFGPKLPQMAFYGTSMNWAPGVTAVPQFDSIENARYVYKLIIEQQQKK